MKKLSLKKNHVRTLYNFVHIADLNKHVQESEVFSLNVISNSITVVKSLINYGMNLDFFL